MHLKVVAKGAKPIQGLTEEKDAQPKRLGPKRATKILKQFGLTAVYNDKKKSKDERKNLRFMITKFAPKREVTTKNGKKYVKSAKIQRLITPDRLRRKRLIKAIKKQRLERTNFTSQNKYMYTKIKYQNKTINLIKGAYEIIIDKCNSYYDIDGNIKLLNNKKEIEEKLRALSGNKLRIISLAISENKEHTILQNQNGY